jgi:hypothetical protein
MFVFFGTGLKDTALNFYVPRENGFYYCANEQPCQNAIKNLKYG